MFYEFLAVGLSAFGAGAYLGYRFGNKLVSEAQEDLYGAQEDVKNLKDRVVALENKAKKAVKKVRA